MGFKWWKVLEIWDLDIGKYISPFSFQVGGGGLEVGSTNWEEIVKDSEAVGVRVSRANEAWQVVNMINMMMIIDVHYNLQFFDSWPVLLSGCDIPSPPVCRASPCHRRQAGKFISAFENIMEHWIWSTFHLLENIIIPQTRRELLVWAWVLDLLSG